MVEFRSEDGELLKHFGSEDLSDDAAVVELLTLQVGDSVSFEGPEGRREYKVVSTQQREVFPLQLADPEPINYLIFVVRPVSEPRSD